MEFQETVHEERRNKNPNTLLLYIHCRKDKYIDQTLK